MVQNIAFIGFFVLWLVAPAVSVAKAWNTPSRTLAIVSLTLWWALLFMALFLMHHVTHGGILRVNFWWE